MLQLLKNNRIRTLKELPNQGESVRIRWIDINKIESVELSTVTLQPQTDDEFSEDDTETKMRYVNRKGAKNALSVSTSNNKQSKSTTNETEVDNATNMDVLAKAAVVVETKDSMALQTSKDKDASQHDDSDHDSFNTAKESLGSEDDTNDIEKKKVGPQSKASSAT